MLRMLKPAGILFIIITSLIASCDNPDEEINIKDPDNPSDDPSSPSYEKGWTLDFSEYLNVDFSISGSGFEPVLLNNGRVLTNVYSGYDWFLVEIEESEGSFHSNIHFTDLGITDLRKKPDGTVLLESVFREEDSYSIGIYNAADDVTFGELMPRDSINDPPSAKWIRLGDEFFYTYNPNVNPESPDPVYIAKWDFDGNLIWRKIVDESGNNKTSDIHAINRDFIYYATVADYDNENEMYKLNKLSSNGEFEWSVSMGEYGRIYDVKEDGFGNLLIVHKKAVQKIDRDGKIIWQNSLEEYPEGYIWGSKPCLTDDGGLFLGHSSSASPESRIYTMIKINMDGNIVWSDEYRDSDYPSFLCFLELPNGGFIVTSLDGYITKYNAL